MSKCLKQFPSKISSGIANYFYRLGVFIANNPWKTIVISVLIAGFGSFGFIKFRVETNTQVLFIPRDSQFLRTTHWMCHNVENSVNVETLILVAPNVLEPKVLQKLAHARLKIIDASGQLQNGTIIKWQDVCLKMPHFAGSLGASRKRQIAAGVYLDEGHFEDLFYEADNFEKRPRNLSPITGINSEDYCKFIYSLPWSCVEESILKIWDYDLEKINKLTLPEVIKALNTTTESSVTGEKFDELLGAIERDQNGQIISARALENRWFARMKRELSAWQNAYLKEMKALDSSDPPNSSIKIYYSISESYNQILYDSIARETLKFGLGFLMIFIFVQIVFSKFSWTEMRFILGTLGLLTILFSLVCTCGFFAVIGIPYAVLHTSLPFLLMGLGVDDLFIMMACWKKVKDEELPLEERMGLMLKRAGASITVASFTNIIAFLVGSLTAIPTLQSFCFYAAFGVLTTYFYAITFFVAVFILDEYRIRANRNAFVPCIVHKEAVKPCCDLNLMHKCLLFFYSKIILTKPGKVIVLLMGIGLTSIGTLYLCELKPKFDPMWFIPRNSYHYKYKAMLEKYFSKGGYEGAIFMGRLNYTESLPQILKLVDDLKQNHLYFSSFDSWVEPFAKFVQKSYNKDLRKDILTDVEWRNYLSTFLWSPAGRMYEPFLHFDKPLKCEDPTGNMKASSINFQFKKFTNRDVYVPVMHKLTDIIKQHNINSGDGFVQPWSPAFAYWIPDEIIDKEIYRNIGIGLVCLMTCTFLIILDIQLCFWIFICVTFTLINVGGFMHLWGLTIDLVSCIGLQLAIGLCVDYAAHIGHNFVLIADGDRNKRMLDAIILVGAAIIYGGTSTLLALLLLSTADMYVFFSFFKIFILVVVFGIFHGVVFLPVILSTIGPKPL